MTGPLRRARGGTGCPAQIQMVKWHPRRTLTLPPKALEATQTSSYINSHKKNNVSAPRFAVCRAPYTRCLTGKLPAES